MLKKLSLVLASVVSAFAMHSAEININEKDLEISTKFDLGQFNETVEPDTTFVGFKYLNGSDDYSEDENGDPVDVSGYVELNFLMKREVQNSGITLGIGVKANYTKVDEVFITLPLGLELGYNIPVSIPMTVGASVYYAPESLAITNADNYLEYRLEGSVELIERAAMVVGYRHLEMTFNVDGNTYDIIYNDAAYFGFRFDF